MRDDSSCKFGTRPTKDNNLPTIMLETWHRPSENDSQRMQAKGKTMNQMKLTSPTDTFEHANGVHIPHLGYGT